jgi:molybdate transport system ATP-binding protein
MASDDIAIQFSGSLGNFAIDVDVRVPMRGVCALFGPSGSGKTTLLRCVSGLTRLPGTLRVGDELWQDDRRRVFMKPHQRPVGYIFQEPSLFPHLTVHGNLLFGASRARGSARTELPDFDEVVDLLSIEHLLSRSPVALSGGERQRIALGRALLANPRVLLMDEPFSALDRSTKEDLLPYLESLHERLSIPVLYVSHDIGEVSRLADTLVVLSEGRVVATGPIEEIFERLDLQPETGRFEAGVVLTGTVAEHDESFRMTHLDVHGQRIAVPQANVRIGERVRLRIRARDVALALEPPRQISVRNILAGTVQAVVEESDTAFAETLIDIGGARLRARITRDAVASLGLEPGMEVFALVKSIAFDRQALSAGARID